jgi:choline-sulfatase
VLTPDGERSLESPVTPPPSTPSRGSEALPSASGASPAEPALARLGRACLLGLAVALVSAIPTALRTATAGGGFALGLLVGVGVLVPVGSLALGLVQAAARGFRGLAGPRTPPWLTLGSALWLGLALPVLAALGALLQTGTNHRGLGGAAFGVLGAVVTLAAALVAARLIGLARDLVARGTHPWLVAAPGAVVGVLPVLLVAATLAPSAEPGGAAVRAALLDGAIALVATALAASFELPAPAARLARRVGAPVAALVVVVALVVVGRSPETTRAMRTAGGLPSALLGALEAWTDRDGDGEGAYFGGRDCDEGDAQRHPGAAERAGDGVDQDCDGVDVPSAVAELPPAPASAPAAVAPSARPTPSAAPNPASQKPDLYLVTLDTVRADHTTVYGYATATTPRLAALAAGGVVFEHAYATGTDTQRALAPLVSGRRLSDTPRDTREWPTILPEAETLAERLARAGYQTAAVTSFTWLSKDRGFAQGFDMFETAYDKDHPERGVTGAHAIEAAKGVLARRAADRPLFLWLHLFDAHARYVEHAEHALGKGALGRYDGEIAYVDARLGELVDAVAAGPRAASALWLVHGSHGEAFSEHGVDGHGSELHDEVLRVPFVLSGAGLSARRYAERAVSTLDVVPTLLAAAGANDASLPGVSLLSAARGEAFARAPIYARAHRRSAVVDWPLKLIRVERGKRDRLLLFDLATDPGEKSELSASRPDDLTRLIGVLDGLEKAAASAPGQGGAAP